MRVLRSQNFLLFCLVLLSTASLAYGSFRIYEGVKRGGAGLDGKWSQGRGTTYCDTSGWVSGPYLGGSGTTLSVSTSSTHRVIKLQFGIMYVYSHDCERFYVNFKWAEGTQTIYAPFVCFNYWYNQGICHGQYVTSIYGGHNCQYEADYGGRYWPWQYYEQREYYFAKNYDLNGMSYSLDLFMGDGNGACGECCFELQEARDEWWGFNEIYLTAYMNCAELGWSYQSSQCVTSCASNRYAFRATDGESYCMVACGGNQWTKYLTAQNTCTGSCDAPLGLIQAGEYLKCVDCGAGNFRNSQGFCERCSSSCATCFGSATQCTSCAAGIALWNSVCYSTCPGDRVKGSGTCICKDGTWEADTKSESCPRCDSNCLTCSGAAKTCTSCYGSQLLNTVDSTCVDECPKGTFESSGKCFICDSNCLECVTSATTCTNCRSDLLLNTVLQRCIAEEEIPFNYYFFVDGGVNKTSPCNSTCHTCSASYSNCTSCTGELSLNYNTCVKDCPAKRYSSVNVCYDCDEVCATCVGEEDFCTSCEQDIHPLLFPDQGTCSDSCPIGRFETTLENIGHLGCLLCDENCYNCEVTATNCTWCTEEHNTLSILDLPDRVCIDQCPDGKYTYGLDVNTYCTACDPNCQTCDGNYKKCTSCFSEMTLDQNNKKCVGDCDEGFYKVIGDDGSSQCVTCDPDSLENRTHCAACTSLETCFKCVNPFLYVENENRCIDKCEDGYFRRNIEYPDYTLYACSLCSSNCNTCDQMDTQCTSCNGDDVLFTANNTCIETCPDGFYTSVNKNGVTICGPCDSKCLTCSGTDIKCTSCSGSRGLDSSTSECLLECRDGSYFKDNVCESCLKGCARCNGAEDNCLECNLPYLWIPDTNECVETCPEHYYETYKLNNNGKNGCLQCVENCLGCKGTSTNCTSCADGLFHMSTTHTCVTSCQENGLISYQSTCVKECPAFLLTETQECFDVCPEGYEGSLGLCREACPDGFSYNNTLECSRVCPDDLYLNLEKLECQACNFSCSVCSPSEYGSCNACKGGYVIDGECFSTCSSSLPYYNTTHCLEYCPIYQIGSQCVNECPAGTINDEGHCINKCPETRPFNESGTCVEKCASLYYDNKTLVCTSECQSLNLVAYNGVCIEKCPANAPNIKNFQCTTECPRYSFMNECVDECPAGFAPDSLERCIEFGECEDGYQRNSKTRNCDPCIPPCKKCFDYFNDTCTACSNDLYLYDSKCLEECPEGFYQSEGVSGNLCLPCDYTCSTCSVSRANCTSCEGGRYIYGNTCVECIGNYQVVGDTCVRVQLHTVQQESTLTFTLMDEWRSEKFDPSDLFITVISVATQQPASTEEVVIKKISTGISYFSDYSDSVPSNSSMNVNEDGNITWTYKLVNMLTSEFEVTLKVEIMADDGSEFINILATIYPDNEKVFILPAQTEDAISTLTPPKAVSAIKAASASTAGVLALGSTVATGASAVAGGLGPAMIGGLTAMQDMSLVSTFDNTTVGFAISDFTKGMEGSLMAYENPQDFITKNRRLLQEDRTRMGYAPSTFFSALGLVGPLIILSILFSGVVYMVMDKLNQESKWVIALRSIWLYSLPLIVMLIFYDSVGLACLLQIKYSIFDSYFETGVAAVVFVLYMVGYPLLQFWFTNKFQDRLGEKDFQISFGVLYLGLKTDDGYSFLFGGIQTVRRLSSLLLFVIFSDHPIVASIGVLSGYIIISAVSIMLRPFKSTFYNVIFIMANLLSCLSFACLLYNLASAWEGVLLVQREKIGQIYVYSCIAVLVSWVIGAVGSIGMFIKGLFDLRKSPEKEGMEKLHSNETEADAKPSSSAKDIQMSELN